MRDFVYHNPTKLVFGKNSMSEISSNVETFGKKVLITYGKGSIKRSGIYDKVIKQLKGFDVKEFGGIEPNPRVETIRKAREKFRKFKPDIVLAVGGGSVIDGSKLLVASLYYIGDPWDFLTREDVRSKKYVPLGVILTLAATGSEMNAAAVITRWEANKKLFFIKDEVRPKFSILDPQNTYTVPKDQTAYGIVDSFSHVLEQYVHTVSNVPLQDRLSEAILLTLIENAPVVLKKPKNYTARANIMYSATMALNDIISMGTGEDWATHAIEHEISAFYDIPHAAGLAIITPRWMRVVGKESDKRKKIAHYGRRIWGLKGSEKAVFEGAIKKTHQFFKSLGVRMSLDEWGIGNENIKTISDRLVKDRVGERPLKRKEIGEILQNCLK